MASKSDFQRFWSPFGSLLGLSWGHLGFILAPTWPSWLHLGALLGLSWRIFGHLGDHVDLLGRSVALWWLSWLVFGPNFNSLDVQTKKIATILASHVRLLLFSLHVSLAKCTSPLHWSIVPLMCISSAPFSLTSYAQLAFGTSHPLVCACQLHPVIANSYLPL